MACRYCSAPAPFNVAVRSEDPVPACGLHACRARTDLAIRFPDRRPKILSAIPGLIACEECPSEADYVIHDRTASGEDAKSRLCSICAWERKFRKREAVTCLPLRILGEATPLPRA